MAKPSELSSTEKDAVCRLRERVEDVLTSHYDTEFNLLRWLQAYSYDLEMVVPKLRDHLRFRQSSWNLDELPVERDIPMQDYLQWGLTGLSGKDNCLVYIEQSGRNDVEGVINAASVLHLIRAKVFDYERIHREVMKIEAQTGKQSGVIGIHDALELGPTILRHITGPLKTAVVIETDNNYSELFSKIFIVNSPKFIYPIWSIVRPFLPERMREKIQIFKPNSNWREAIKEVIDPGVLPARWNRPGTEDDFQFDLPLVNKVPTSLYSRHRKLGPMAKTIVISAGKFKLVNIEIEETEVCLKFGFQAYGEVGFGVFYTEDPEEDEVIKMEMVYPQFSRLQGPFELPAVDELQCKKVGFYKIWFSNKYSRFTSLKVEYLIKLNEEIFC